MPACLNEKKKYKAFLVNLFCVFKATFVGGILFTKVPPPTVFSKYFLTLVNGAKRLILS